MKLFANAPDGSYRHVLRILIPMVLNNMAFMIMQFTDRILLSRYSSEAIQAAVPAGTLSFTLTIFFCAVAGYSGTFVAQFFGAKNEEACRRACGAGVFLSLIFTPVFWLLHPICCYIFGIMQDSASLRALEEQYAFWMCIGGTFVSLQWTLSGYLTGRNRVNICTAISFVGCGMNILLDVLLIFGYCGLPEGGLQGAAIATFLSTIFIVCCLILAIASEKQNRQAPLRDWFLPPPFLIKRVLRFGTPNGLQGFFDMGSFTLFVLLTANLGALALATSNIALTINHLAFSPLLGFSNATALLVGQFQGARKTHLARQSCNRCLVLGGIYMIAIGSVFIFLPEFLLNAFRSPDAPFTVEEMLSLGKILLLCMAIWGLFDTCNIIYGGALKGAGDTRFVMYILLLGGWLVFLPGEVLVLRILHLGIIEGWIVQLLYIVGLAFCFFRRWKSSRWETIDLTLLTEKKDAPVDPATH